MTPDRIILAVAGIEVGTVGPAAADRWAAVLAAIGAVEMVDVSGEVVETKEKVR